MKIPIRIFFLVLISLNLPMAKGNDSLVYSYQDFSVGIHSSVFDFRPHITFNHKRHQIGVGMVIRKPLQYNWYISSNFYSYSTGSSEKGFGINGANLLYRFYPLKPKESFTVFFENNVSLIHDRLYFNGAFYQRNFRLTEAIHFMARYKFLQRYAIFMGLGPGLSFHIANDNEGINLFFSSFEQYPRLDLHLNLTLGFEFGIN